MGPGQGRSGGAPHAAELDPLRVGDHLVVRHEDLREGAGVLGVEAEVYDVRGQAAPSGNPPPLRANDLVTKTKTGNPPFPSVPPTRILLSGEG